MDIYINEDLTLMLAFIQAQQASIKADHEYIKKENQKLNRLNIELAKKCDAKDVMIKKLKMKVGKKK